MELRSGSSFLVRAGRISLAPVWPAACAAVFIAIAVASWGEWTVSAFPLDAGREMIVPRLLLEGKTLYSDIRCFYGPTGYWLNAGMAWFLGAGPQDLWLAGAVRFALTLALLWMLARRLLSGPLALLGMSFGAYGLFFSFVMPYSAGIGWGALLTVAGLLCLSRRLQADAVGSRLRDAQDAVRPASLAWSVAAAALFSLAATTKQEYAVVSAVLVAVLLADHLLRPSIGSTVKTLAAVSAAAVLPFAAIAAIVLARVPVHVLLHENLWIPELMDYLGGGAGYCLEYLGDPLRLTTLVELIALLVAAAALVTALFSTRAQTAAWTAVLASTLTVFVSECYSQTLPRSAWNVFAYPKPRLRELTEALPMLCVPVSLAAIGTVAVQACRGGAGSAWARLTGEHRLGIACAGVCLAFTMREVPGAAGLLRQPLTPVVVVWLLALVVPRVMAWGASARRLWTAGLAVLLVAGTLFGIDNLRFYRMRPGTWLEDSAGRMYAWQRRKPFTPEWFGGAVQIVERNRGRIGGGAVACIPEGAWVNALCDLPWPTRDTQWLPYFELWIVEDLANRPPEFVLAMAPVDSLDMPRAAEVLQRNYEIVSSNEQGMVLYKYKCDRTQAAGTQLTGELQ